jgi:hypothetical protein
VSARGSRQTDRQANAVVQEIIELATRYGLMSRETSYVAVERRETPVEGEVQLRRIPIALTADWGGLRDRVHAFACIDTVAGRPAMARPASARAMHDAEANMLASGPASAPSSSVFERLVARMPSVSRRARHAEAPARRSAERAGGPLPDQRLQQLIRLQSANGSWDLNREFADVIGRALDLLEGEIAAIGTAREYRTAWATALAIAWLRRQAADARDEWEMLAAKGEHWLETSAPPRPDRRLWIDRAEELLF